jgi:uncharacterized membrane protein YkvI
MKNLKTTVAGVITAALVALTNILQNGAKLEDWKTWVVPVAIAIMGYVSKDYNATGKP